MFRYATIKKNFQTIQRGQALKPDDKPSNLLLLFSFLTWTRISKTIDRNSLMVELYKNALVKQAGSSANNNQQQQNSELGEENKLKYVKHQDIVRLYDIIIQVGILKPNKPKNYAIQMYYPHSALTDHFEEFFDPFSFD